MQARGRKSQLLMAFEDVFGQTPETPEAIRLPFESCSIRASQNLNEDNTIRNNRNPAQPSRGFVDVSGQTVVPVDTVAFGYWLKALFGAPTTTGDGPYTHVFKPAEIQPSMVLERGFTDIGKYVLSNGCKVSGMSIDIGGEGDQNATIDIMGASEILGNNSFADDPINLPLTKFNRFQAAVILGGAVSAKITAGNISFNSALDGDQYLIGGQGFRGDIPEGIFQPSGSITALFEDHTLLEMAVNGTETSISFKWTNGPNSLEIKFPEVIFERTSPAIEGPQGVVVELPFRGYYDDATEGASVVVTLVNNHESYE